MGGLVEMVVCWIAVTESALHTNGQKSNPQQKIQSAFPQHEGDIEKAGLLDNMSAAQRP